jgi:hypothetical protein
MDGFPAPKATTSLGGNKGDLPDSETKTEFDPLFLKIARTPTFQQPALPHLSPEPSVGDVRNEVHESLALRASLEGDGYAKHTELSGDSSELD